MKEQKTKNNYWFRSGLINLSQNALSVLLGLGSFWLLIRILDKDQYGTWVLFMTTITLLELTRNGLVQNAMVKHLAAANKSEKRLILTASITINACITIAVILMILVIAPFLSKLWDAPDLTKLFYLYILIFIFSGFQTLLNGVEQANFSFKGVFISNTTRQLLFFAFVAYCYIYDKLPSLQDLLHLQMVSVLICTLLAWSITRHYFKLTKRIDRGWIVKLINYGKYSFGTSISSSLAGSLDQMMLGGMLSKTAAASYNIAIKITNLVDIPTNAMASIVFPQGAKRMEENGPQAIKYLYEKSVGAILAILAPALVFIYFFAGPLVHLLADSKYDDSVPLLRVTLFFSLFVPYGRQVGTMFDAVGKTKLNFTLVVLTASINILLNFFFIRQWGAIGAAYATLIANFIGFVISQKILRQHFKVNWLNTWVYAWHFYPELYRKYFKKDGQ